MVRAQVQFTEEQAEALRLLSAESGKSIAEIVRLGVELYLDAQKRPSRQERVERALSIVGKYSSGLTDVSENHDRYLAEAFGE
jgi:glutamate formiminotransferase